MIKNKRYMVAFLCCILISTVPVFAQEPPPADTKREDLWICLDIEAASFSSFIDFSLGFSLSLGYGDRVAIGFKAAFFWEVTPDNYAYLELSPLIRLYLLKNASISGPYVQLAAGAVFLTKDKAFPVPAEKGDFFADIYFGWRFLLGERWFVEPNIRVGWRFLVGGGVSGGIRF